MPTQIFVNLPVRDLEKSKAFFGQIGYAFNPQFTDENATCIVISDTIYAMLLTEPFFQGFTDKKLCDTRSHVEAIVALSCESRGQVDTIADKAVAAGGREPQPAKDHGFMYERGFEDLDGHLWSVFYMDPATIQQD